MPYDNLYLEHALDNALLYAISVREAALLIALDNDTRDQSEIDTELPNEGDYVVGMSPELEPSGKLKASRDHIEKSILRATETGRMKFALCARTQDDKVDAIYSLVSGTDIESWCREYDMRYGEWWMRWQEDENDFIASLADDIVARRMPSPLERIRTRDEEDAAAEYRRSEADHREAMYTKLLADWQGAKTQLEELQVKLKAAEGRGADSESGLRGRNSLLAIIAALAEELGDRLPVGSSTWKRAEAVSTMTQKVGASVSAVTVDKVLKEATSIVDRRKRNSRE
ncbi:hypothetical protein [Burkholderia gladioli]|uniref:hypothetical protein n=1 Tax=Burkholderia gladioli TaxID=28095 RepID=UPI000F5422A2|nr:hypothetical protein [Burkholderia gladioli]